MKTLISYCKPYFGFVSLTLVIKTVGTLMDLVIPYLLGVILDDVVPHCTAEHLSPVFYWGSLMALCAVIALVTNVYANRRISFFAKSVIQNLRKDLFDKTLSLSAAQTDTFTVPSLVARMSSDTYTLHNMLNTLFRAGIRAPLLLLGGVVITVSIEPVLSLALIALLPLMASVVILISKKGVVLYKKKQEKVDAMVEKIRDCFTGVRVIKALSKVEHEKRSFQTINEDLSRREQKAGIIMSVSRPVVNVCLNLGMTAVVLLGAFRVHTGHSTPGQIISFMSYFTIILNATLMLTRIFTVSSKGIASAQRIREVLTTDPALLPIPELQAEKSDFYLEFCNVSFSYHKTRPTVEKISFGLKKGQTLGILGGTGSGKSTLIQLLLRFYDPDAGTILLEGKDLRSFLPEDLRSKFGVVFQNDFLLADSLAENIRFLRDLTDDEIRKAAETAQAMPFISALEEGFNYPLATKGANLSGGQRQRTLIARALAGEPDILILDDASSALDYRTDARFRQALSAQKERGATVIVAQRISSIRNCDLILVLENGAICGKGTHDFLLKTCPVYQEIAHSQMGDMAL